MLDINYIRENTDEVKKRVALKNFDPSFVDEFIKLDAKRRKLLSEEENLRHEENEYTGHSQAIIRAAIELLKEKPKKLDSKYIVMAARQLLEEKKTQVSEKVLEAAVDILKREKQKEDFIEHLKSERTKIQKDFDQVFSRYLEVLYSIPNIPSNDTPIGKDESENKVIRQVGEPRKFNFKVKDHLEIGKDLGIIDTDTAAKVAGARFNYLKGDLVLLQNALYQFAISVLTDEKILRKIADKVHKSYIAKPFIPVIPPLFINPDVYKRMARLSADTEIERYHIERDDQYLIGSAEHTLGPIYMDRTLNEKDLPLRYFAFTPAFRREAGSYGKDTKGILRQHQFDKLEMESFATPEDGLNEQNFFVSIQEYFMQSLEIPYQVVAICTGDMGGPDYRQIDIECWMPGQGKYRETHTSDYMTDYQARRLDTKVKTKNGNEFVHMNDATAFAMGRTMIAILENYQNENGSVTVPRVLQKWMGKKTIGK